MPCILLVPAAFSPGLCVILPLTFIIKPETLSPIDVFRLGTPFLDTPLDRAALVFLTRGEAWDFVVWCVLCEWAPFRRCMRVGLVVVVVVVVVTVLREGLCERVKAPMVEDEAGCG